MKKYEFTGKTMQYDGHTLHQIRALRDLAIPSNPHVADTIHIHAGDIGGWIEKEDDLSHEGNCWVNNDAKVYGNASIIGNAYVGNNAIVKYYSVVADNARVIDNACVEESSHVFENAIVCNSAVVKGRSKIHGNAVIRIKAQIYYSEIYGGAEIMGAKMCFQKLCNSTYYFESQFGAKKYEFTGKTIEYEGYTLHQIRALRDLYIAENLNSNVTTSISVNVGDIGGWICSEDALSHDGNCWVDHNAKVYGCGPRIRGNAYVGNEATVCGSTIADQARIVGNADIRGFTRIFGNALIGGSAVVKGRSKIYGNATIIGAAKAANADIHGNVTIGGTVEVDCKTLRKGCYDCEDDFREKRPEPSYEKAFMPVDNSLSYYEALELERYKCSFIDFLSRTLRQGPF